MSKQELIEYFEELCGPHLDPDVRDWSVEDLVEVYEHSQEEVA